MSSGTCNSALRVVAVAAILAVVGCVPTGVREDRRINFSPDGRAAFQHGGNGVFVTDPATGKPKRIYETSADDLAVSPPAWDAAGKRMIFTVARAADGTRHGPLGDAPAPTGAMEKIRSATPAGSTTLLQVACPRVI